MIENLQTHRMAREMLTSLAKVEEVVGPAEMLSMLAGALLGKCKRQFPNIDPLGAGYAIMTEIAEPGKECVTTVAWTNLVDPDYGWDGECGGMIIRDPPKITDKDSDPILVMFENGAIWTGFYDAVENTIFIEDESFDLVTPSRICRVSDFQTPPPAQSGAS